jgi:tRNA A-37 threonylcarbamoyl transferase component Bud32
MKRTLSFCRYVAGPCKITAACIWGDSTLSLLGKKANVEILLVIQGFKPRLMNYVNVFDETSVIMCAVDEWVFERDVDRGFLGEALAGGLLFPYSPLVNTDYLHVQEVKLKKRLIRELLENLVLEFPELSYQMQIKPEYFMYEAMLVRARLYPPIMYDLLDFLHEKDKKKNIEAVLQGYQEALKELEKEKTISFLDGYVTIGKQFVERTKNLRVRFMSLLKPAQKGLFTNLLSIFPQVVNFLSQNREILTRLQKLTVEGNLKIMHSVEDTQKYLFVPTAEGRVPLANRVDIRNFARKVLSADKNEKVSIEEIGGVLNDAYLVKASVKGVERKVVAKRFRDWSSFKWFPLTLWTMGTRTFAVLGRSRLERECTINQLLHSNGFAVPKLLHVSHAERLVFMEYVEGESLEKTIKRITNAKKVEERREDLNTISEVGALLARVHALGISLGDTKPENILCGKDGKIYLLDFEQASQNGDKAWDVAEFLYYAGHYFSPFVSVRSAELIAKAFIRGYLKAGGSVATVKSAANPKYTKVFSVFTLPHVMLVIANLCGKADKLKE